MTKDEKPDHDCTASVEWYDRSFHQRDDGTDVMVEVGMCNECNQELEGVWIRESIEAVE